MATCTIDIQFTYVLVGWEGSAANSRVLKDALTCRNIICVPEARFQMLKSAPPFSYKIEMKIVIACSILHNYICKEDYNDMFELENDDSDDEVGGGGDEVRLVGENSDEDRDDFGDEGNLSTTMRGHRALESTRAAQFRDAIATSMWNDY
ncbi:uncharacterized protein [Aristolochia californica]|uniref:uncharacterized protein n=1 Tax=Aristolochia californica TaxID=171875 RepID=UPI0035DCFDB9